MVMDIEVTSNLGPNGQPLAMLNNTELSSVEIAGSAGMREVAAVLSRWVDNARSASGATSMFDRGMFTPPDNPYDEMRAARNALKYDAVVSGVAEVTEAYAFQGAKWESDDADGADVFNQLSRDMNLDAVIRAMWREEFTYGQVVVAKLWDWKTYTVRGRGKTGVKRKKSYRVWAPLRIRILDSTKTVPVGTGPLGGETLAWQAGKGEIGHYAAAMRGDVIDPLMAVFFTGTYHPAPDEAYQLSQHGVDPNQLLACNPEFVFRHTLTKPDYERFADIRLKSCFALLDLKRQLLASDRAVLIGSANYILLIRKGDREAPAQPEEMANLRENYNFLAKMPVIISDHRLEIDIIAPKTDFTLNGEKYEVVNNQILSRLLGTLTIGGRGQRNETQNTISSAVARVMENRRHMLKRTLELEIARAVVEHPNNAGVFDGEPNLVYTPRNVALAMDPSYLQGLLSLRTQREISRETILEYFGLDEATEALRLEWEGEVFDDIFHSQVPFAAANPMPTGRPSGDPTAEPTVDQGTGKPTPNGTPEDPKLAGKRGGRPAGGGTGKQSPAAIAKPRTPKGNPRIGS